MIRVFSFLQRNPQSGILHFRFTIPLRYRSVVGKREIKRSLQTTDKRLAIPKALCYYTEIQNRLQKIGDEMNKNGDGFQKITFDELSTTPDGLKAKGVVIDTGDPEKDFALAQRLLGTIPSPALKDSYRKPASVQSEKLSAVVELYRKEMLSGGNWQPKTDMMYSSLFDDLVQILRNPEMAAVTHADARKVKEVFLVLPPNMRKKFKGKTIEQVLAMNLQKERQSIKSVNDKLQRISSLFIWADQNGYTEMNPFKGLKLREKRRARDQKPRFSIDDIKRIFSPGHCSRNSLDPGQYWIPLLALYTGARLEELSQLRTEDVLLEDDIVIIRITEEAGHLKNRSSEREVPLHSKILTMGFLQYRDEMLGKGRKKLFPELWNVKSKPGRKLGNWFNRTHIAPLGLEAGKTFHSFRHTLRDELSQRLVDERILNDLLGHEQTGSTGATTYSKAMALKTLKEKVELLDFLV